jgi:hypothetical protein
VDCRRRVDGDKTREAHELHLAKRAQILEILQEDHGRELAGSVAQRLADALYPSPYEPGEEPQ